MTSKETVQKLTMYATVKDRLANPEDVIDKQLSFTKLGRLYVRLRRELEGAGVPEEVLNKTGSELSNIIYDAITHFHIYTN